MRLLGFQVHADLQVGLGISRGKVLNFKGDPSGRSVYNKLLVNRTSECYGEYIWTKGFRVAGAELTELIKRYSHLGYVMRRPPPPPQNKDPP